MPNSLTLPHEKQAPLATLTDLAVQINNEHRQAEAALNTGLQHARHAGELLLQAKKLCEHGEWLPWLEQNFDGSARSAQAYMLVAERWPLIEANSQRAAHLSFRDALRLVAEPKPEPPRDITTSTKVVDEDFLAAIPELSPNTMLVTGDSNDDAYYIEVHPSIEHPGFYHLLLYTELDTAAAEVVYDRRPVRYTRELLGYVLQYVHGITPTRWITKPVEGETPWPVEADKTSKPGKFRPVPWLEQCEFDAAIYELFAKYELSRPEAAQLCSRVAAKLRAAP